MLRSQKPCLNLTPFLVHSICCIHTFLESHFHLFQTLSWPLELTRRPSLGWPGWQWQGTPPTPWGCFTGASSSIKTSFGILKTIDWRYYNFFSYSKNLRALAKMPADFPYRFNSTCSWIFLPKLFILKNYHPRKHTEAVINERVSIMKNAATIEVKHCILQWRKY